MTQGAQEKYAVAIIGMAGRFPGANTVEGLWKNLCDGADCLHVSTDEDLKKSGVLDWQRKHPDFVRVNGVIEGAGDFDAPFFGFSAHDASIVDPQHRVLLECCWEAFEDAGYDPLQSGEGVGVFAGAGTNTYRTQDLGPDTDTATTLQLMVGGEKDFLATRIAYKLNLTGPAITLQTACSTSLVAVQMAYESLRSGTSAMALAGGVSIMFPQKTGYIYQPGMILSPDGYCRAFDARAAGTTMGRGAGAVLLKPLDAAVRDGDQIYAVIRGAAINNDGSNKGGYTAPGVKGQVEVIRRAMDAAGFTPGTVRYVEAHGTGTEIGDSIEIAALAEAFSGSELPPESCTVSSLKASIGHLDAAAGVANLIKAAMAVRERVLPGTMHYETPNPELHLSQTPFRIGKDSIAYTGAAPMRAGVSAFGIGGTNVHVCLEEWQGTAPSSAKTVAHLFPLSANTETALASQRAQLADHLESHPEQALADVAHTLQSGRKQFSHRYYAVAASREELIEELRKPEMAKGQSSVSAAKDPEIYFIFPGQGAQYVNMGRGLYENDAVFRDVIDRCSVILEPLIGLDLRGVLYPAPGDEEAATAILRQTRITQPALFILEYALAMRLLANGIKPTAMLGHSLGEYVAVTVAGVFKIEHILAIVAERGRRVQSIPPGSMLAVSMAEEAVLAQLPPELSIAAVNAPKQTIVSGPTEAIEAFAAMQGKQRVACAALPTSHAFHSAMLDPIVGTTAETASRFPREVPNIPVVSNLTGKWLTDTEATDPWYYDAHLRQAVRFADGLQLLIAKGSGVIVEVGPGETLLPLARSATKTLKGFRLASTTRRASSPVTDEEHWLQAMGQLWLAGVLIDWDRMHGEHRPRRVSLPTYPFERQYYWIDDAWGKSSSARKPGGPIVKRDDVTDWLYTRSWQSAPHLQAQSRLMKQAKPTRWAVLANHSDRTLQAVTELLSEGRVVLRVTSAETFARNAKGVYCIHPDRPADYKLLLDAWQQEDCWPEHLVYALSPTDETTAPSAAYERLFHLAQALQQSGKTEGMTLHVLTDRAYDILGTNECVAANTAAASLADVLGLELPGIQQQTIDYDGRTAAVITAPQLTRELLGFGKDELVAYRGRNRWLSRWVPMPLPAPENGKPPLRQGGTYILTGGIGGIGLVLAEHLARDASAHLVLVGRSKFPPASEWKDLAADAAIDAGMREKLRVLLRIQDAGGTVDMQQADVTNAVAMQAVVAAAAATQGGLAGIIHAAGVSDFTVIGATEPETVERIFAAKALGTGWIEAAIVEHRLDFVLLCSSMSALVPSVGVSAYGSANAYLDGFAAKHDNPEGTRVFAVNWDRWSETGMAYEAAAITKSSAQQTPAVEFGISNAEAVDVFNRVLTSQSSQIAVSTRPIDRWLESVRAQFKGTGGKDGSADGEHALHPRPELSLEYVGPGNDAERAVIEIWQDLLGIDRVGVNDDFFELGGHSLLGAQFISRIRERFQVDIPLRTIFETPTPAACALLVAEKLESPAMEAVPAGREAERVEIEI